MSPRRFAAPAKPTWPPRRGRRPGPLTNLYSFSSKTNLNGTPGTFVVPNLAAFENTLNINSNTGRFELTGVTNASARGNFTTVDERDLGAFAQAVFDGEIGSMRLRGDVGVRYVETRQTSTGYQNGGPAPGFTLVEVTRTYDNWLPSANFSLNVTPEFIIRAAAAKVIARPNIATVNPGGSFSISGGNRTLSLGNPLINPTKATDYDLSFELFHSRIASSWPVLQGH